jgi:hypothetical protein
MVIMAKFIFLVILLGLVCGCARVEDQFTQVYFNPDPSWLSFSIANNEGSDQVYLFEILGKNSDSYDLLYFGSIAVNDASTATVYFPPVKNYQKVIVRLPKKVQEISFFTSYVPPEKRPEWRPEIIPDVRWELQDPLVQHFYRYATQQPKEDNKR